MVAILKKWLKNRKYIKQSVPTKQEDDFDNFEKKFNDFLNQYREAEKVLNISEKWNSLSLCKEDAISFAYKHINEEPARYMDDRKLKGSYAYRIAHCGESINNRFRQGRPDDDDIACAKYISKHSNDVPLILYRGVGKDVCRMMYENASNMNGVDLYEKSILYCSLVKGCEIRSKYHLRIFVPEGSQLFYAGDVNEEQYRYEVDIQAGGRLKILSVDDKYINCQLLSTRTDFLSTDV